MPVFFMAMGLLYVFLAGEAVLASPQRVGIIPRCDRGNKCQN